ncbi:hypothetical protein SEVIR_5G439432v4 [Setaria viridis]
MDGWVGDELIMKQDHQLPSIYMKPKKRGFFLERQQNYACREQGLTGMISSHPSAFCVCVEETMCSFLYVRIRRRLSEDLFYHRHCNHLEYLGRTQPMVFQSDLVLPRDSIKAIAMDLQLWSFRARRASDAAFLQLRSTLLHCV